MKVRNVIKAIEKEGWVLDRTRGICLTHLDESKAAGAAGFAVGRQRHRLHRAVLREQRSYIGLAGTER